MYDANSLSVLKINSWIKMKSRQKDCHRHETSIHISGLLGGGLGLKSTFGTDKTIYLQSNNFL
jgi:hypothetical protein